MRRLILLVLAVVTFAIMATFSTSATAAGPPPSTDGLTVADLVRTKVLGFYLRPDPHPSAKKRKKVRLQVAGPGPSAVDPGGGGGEGVPCQQATNGWVAWIYVYGHGYMTFRCQWSAPPPGIPPCQIAACGWGFVGGPPGWYHWWAWKVIG